MSMWAAWRGCHKCSTGCLHCYIRKGDARRGVNTDEIVRGDNFDAPVRRLKSGAYKMKSGQTVYTCFQSDFLLEDADKWRGECWDIIAQRPDLTFLFLTKRIDRFMKCVPANWGEGWDNVVVGCTVEDKETAEYRLSIFDALPIKHKNIICQPLIEGIDISNHLTGVELVVAGGESDSEARALDYEWILSLREQCLAHRVDFQFRQCGSNFLKDGRLYRLNVRQLCQQAKKADIDLKF